MDLEVHSHEEVEQSRASLSVENFDLNIISFAPRKDFIVVGRK